MKVILFILSLLAFQPCVVDAADLPVDDGVEYCGDTEKNNFSYLQVSSQDFFGTLSNEFNHRKHYKHIPHYRQHNFARDLYNVQTFRKPVSYLEDTFFVASYSYCKPIGLFLIFPQHYFW